LQTLSFSLERNRSIKTLSMRGCRFLDQGFFAFTDALEQNETVQDLDVYWNIALVPAGCDSMAQVLEKNRSVKKLNLARMLSHLCFFFLI